MFGQMIAIEKNFILNQKSETFAIKQQHFYCTPVSLDEIIMVTEYKEKQQ